tara:strand:- start:25 stop:2655 length:2631 start_codon:yes stop_codon:yes gene_type:complete
MQIIELYIRDGISVSGNVSSLTSDSTPKLIDASATFEGVVLVGNIAFNPLNKKSAKITSITNTTTLVLTDDIFESTVDPYIIKSDFQRLDLFEDESVTITDSLKNVKDVAKIFSPFSQQFNVPASRINSKIFRHYEDQDVTNSFDARFKVDALIKLNGIDYKRGTVRLNGVSLKNNKPHSYKLIFFGETVELKDVLGNSLLSDLIFPSGLNFQYDHDTISPMFQNLGEVCFPLITHSKNMRLGGIESGVYKSTNDEFLNYRDLKPAIKVKHIIDAISRTFPQLNFSNDFFNTEDFRQLYLWLHRDKGFISNASESGGLQTLSTKFHLPTDEGLNLVDGIEVRPLQGEPSDQFDPFPDINATLNFTLVVTDTTQVFRLRVFTETLGFTLTNLDIELSGSLTYNSTTNPELLVSFGPYAVVNATIELSTTNTFTIQNFQINATGVELISGVYEFSSLQSLNTVQINRQMPKIKVLNFISDLFKLYNLVAFKDGDQIRCLPLDDFYREGVSYDITEYVDTTKSDVRKVLQYKNIDFNFKSKKSFLVEKSDEMQNANFGGTSFGDNTFDGGDYKIEVDFEKMMYERLVDETSGVESTIGQGAMIDKDFKPTVGKPLLLYITSQSATTNFILENIDGGSDVTISDHYNRPTQIRVSSGSVVSGATALNFGVEMDEFFRQPSGTTLFEKYYKNYITSVYNRQSRLLKIDAFLPLFIVLNYNLNDTFVIGNKAYRINSVKTNLLTNKSTLELYSLSREIKDIENNIDQNLPRLSSISATATSSSVSLSWTPLGDVVANNITGYDVYKDDVFVETLGDDISGRTITGLQDGTTYKFSIRTRYTIDSNVVFSPDRSVFATTDNFVLIAENDDNIITEQGNSIIVE